MGSKQDWRKKENGESDEDSEENSSDEVRNQRRSDKTSEVIRDS